MGSRHFEIDGAEFASRAAAEEARLDRAEREADAEQQRREAALEGIPGRASQVWGGWVWMTGSTEHAWSKREYRADCEDTVIEVVGRLGIDNALDLEPAE